MPPPTTSSRSGTPSSSRAPVESTTRSSSWGMNGRVTGSEPQAMIACSNPTTVRDPSSAVTSRWLGEANAPSPVTTLTLRALARPARPPVSRLTTDSFQARSLSRSTAGSPKASPCSAISLVSAITLAACSRALEGMQPTLRQTPPRIGRAVDQHHRLAQVGGPEGGAVAAGPGPQHQHLGLHVGLDARRRRRGGSWGGLHRPGRGLLAAVHSLGRPAPGAGRVQEQQDVALRDLVPDPDPELAHRPGLGGGDVHGRLVRLQGDDRVVDRDLVAGGDVHLDDRHAGEVADVGQADLGRRAHGQLLYSSRRRTSSSTLHSCRVNRAARAPSITRWS